jgi:hypothetical protein
MEAREVTQPFFAISMRPPGQIVPLRPGDVLEECICVGPRYRFLAPYGVPKKPVASECEAYVLTEKTRRIEPASRIESSRKASGS